MYGSNGYKILGPEHPVPLSRPPKSRIATLLQTRFWDLRLWDLWKASMIFCDFLALGAVFRQLKVPCKYSMSFNVLRRVLKSSSLTLG